jgi:hypothetical protein
MTNSGKLTRRQAVWAVGGRWLTGMHVTFSVLLAVGLTVLVNALVVRLNLRVDCASVSGRPLASQTRNILTHSVGPLRVICFLERKHPVFAPTGRLLRGFQAVTARPGHTPISISYVDPRRDLAMAAALVGAGVPPNSVVFEAQGRRIAVPADDLVLTNGTARAVFRGETVCAAAIARLGRVRSGVVYWLQGHGEGNLADYDALSGFTTIARELRQEGYDLRTLELWNTKGVPADAETLIVAGPRQTLAAEELTWIETYLTRGGRLLYLVNPVHFSGLEEALERRGVRITPWTAVKRETFSGHDLVVHRYGEHAITRQLTNSVTVFLGSRCLLPASEAAAPEQVRYTPLAWSEGWGTRVTDTLALPRMFDRQEDLEGPVAVAAAVERGGEVSPDVSLQPMRLVVVGERDFVANGTLATRSSGNRDFFVHAVNWLTGMEDGTGIGGGGDAVLWTGLDRRGWMQFTLLAAGAVPLLVLGFGGLLVLIRRWSV